MFRDPTRGGLGTVLSEIAQNGKLGIELNESSLPIDSQVKGACELLGLDPLYVANEGLFMAIVAKEVVEEAIEIILGFEAGQHAAIIGEIVANHPGKVILNNGMGGKRVVHMLVGEQLPRIC